MIDKFANIQYMAVTSAMMLNCLRGLNGCGIRLSIIQLDGASGTRTENDAGAGTGVRTAGRAKPKRLGPSHWRSRISEKGGTEQLEQRYCAAGTGELQGLLVFTFTQDLTDKKLVIQLTHLISPGSTGLNKQRETYRQSDTYRQGERR